jgi:hypothetical protein
MTSQAAIQFDRNLRKLFDARTHWLRAQVRKPTRGNAPQFNRQKIERSIEVLQDLAEDFLHESHAVVGKRALYEIKKQWRVDSSKGRGRTNKKRTFAEWFDKHIPKTASMFSGRDANVDM